MPTLRSCAQRKPLNQAVDPGDAPADAFYFIISYPPHLYCHKPSHPLPCFARCGRSTAAPCICMQPLPLCLVVLAGVRGAVHILPGVNDSLRVGVGFGVEAIVAVATDECLADRLHRARLLSTQCATARGLAAQPSCMVQRCVTLLPADRVRKCSSGVSRAHPNVSACERVHICTHHLKARVPAPTHIHGYRGDANLERE